MEGGEGAIETRMDMESGFMEFSKFAMPRNLGLKPWQELPFKTSQQLNATLPPQKKWRGVCIHGENVSAQQPFSTWHTVWPTRAAGSAEQAERTQGPHQDFQSYKFCQWAPGSSTCLKESYSFRGWRRYLDWSTGRMRTHQPSLQPSVAFL